MNDNITDNTENEELAGVYEEYNKNQKLISNGLYATVTCVL